MKCVAAAPRKECAFYSAVSMPASSIFPVSNTLCHTFMFLYFLSVCHKIGFLGVFDIFLCQEFTLTDNFLTIYGKIGNLLSATSHVVD